MRAAIAAAAMLAAPIAFGQSSQPDAPPTEGISAPPATQSAATTPPVVESSSQPESAASQQTRQLLVFGAILLNPSDDIAATTRREAATEILEMQIPEATDMLRQAIQSRRPVVALAAIAAMQSHPSLPAAMLDHCVTALETASTEIVAALSPVLARYGDEAAAKVGALTQKPAATTRLNAVTALGAFRTRDAAAALMRVLETAPNDHSAFMDPTGGATLRAAVASLERMTGVSNGQDVGAWRSWWARAADESPEQWYRLISESLANRAAALQRQLQDQRGATDRMSKELFSAYRDLFPALSIDEQLRRLPKLLDDPLPTVRRFGISRVSVLARDSVRMPPQIIALVRDALRDELPETRSAAAELLDELDAEQAAEAIAAQLGDEKDPAVVRAMLAVLGRRPTTAALDPVLKLLKDDVVADAAADSLWEMMLTSTVPPVRIGEVREGVRDAMQRRMSPATLRLAALVCEDRDLPELTALLDGDDRTLRAAAAEGFWKRPMRQPLLDRADDDAVYPFAIRALADGPADLVSFNLLAGLRPTESHRRLWSEMIVKLAARLQATDVPAAEELLRAIAYADLPLRRDVLLASNVLQRDTLPAAERLKIVERLAPLLIDLGEANRAWELLESLNGSAASSPSLRVPRFQAAILSGHFDRAAQIDGEPASWISLLDREAERSNPISLRLHDEIVRRFGEALGEDDQRHLEEIRATLPGTNDIGG